MEQPGGRSIFDEQEIINSEIISELHMPQIQENSKFHLKSFSRNHDVFGRNLTGHADLVGFYLVGFFLAGFYPPNFNKNRLFVQNSYFYPIQLQ